MIEWCWSWLKYPDLFEIHRSQNGKAFAIRLGPLALRLDRSWP